MEDYKKNVLSEISALSPQLKADLLAETVEAFCSFCNTKQAIIALILDALLIKTFTLVGLMIGELIDPKGKYIPQIANGLWLIMEKES